MAFTYSPSDYTISHVSISIGNTKHSLYDDKKEVKLSLLENSLVRLVYKYINPILTEEMAVALASAMNNDENITKESIEKLTLKTNTTNAQQFTNEFCANVIASESKNVRSQFDYFGSEIVIEGVKL